MAIEKERNPAGDGKDFIEKRREQRYGVPDRFQRYMTLRVKAGSNDITANLANFSRSGILFESKVPFDAGSKTECVITLSLLLSREIAFRIEVKYCCKNADSYIVGAAIDTIADERWFDVFEEIHDFIVLRKDAAHP